MLFIDKQSVICRKSVLDQVVKGKDMFLYCHLNYENIVCILNCHAYKII